MIGIKDLDGFSALAVERCDILRDYVLVSSEAELKDLMKAVKYPLLVSAYPSADGDDYDVDNFAERNVGLFYVLVPMKESYTKRERTEAWVRSQEGMLQLKQFIRHTITDQSSKYFELFQDNNFGKRSIDPEYNFLGNIGFSLKFEYSTDGL